MTRTPRIDTLGNQLDELAYLATMLAEELGDLHVLAYERAKAGSDGGRVRGGKPNWVLLDTHGDPRARDAYRRLGEATVAACDQWIKAAGDVVRLLRQDGPEGRIGQRRIDIVELALAIEARARRIARGEYEPVRRGPQPQQELLHNVVGRLCRERDKALRDADRLAKRLAVYEPQAAGRGRRRRQKRPPR